MATTSKKAVKIDREEKIIIRNDNAVVVLVNGKTIVIKAIRLAVPDLAERDLEFSNISDFRTFVDNCVEVLNAARLEMDGTITTCS